MLTLISIAALVSAGPFRCLSYNREDCRHFDLVKIPSDRVETVMKIGNSTNLPAGLEDFHGLWYMNGNAFQYEVMSFASAKPYKTEVDTWSIKVYDEKIWSFANSVMGRLLYFQTRQNGFTWKIKKVNESAYQFQPLYNLPKYMLSMTIPISRHVTTFMLLKGSDSDTWIASRSWFHTDIGRTFKMVRIVDGQGQRTSKYENDYLFNAQHAPLLSEFSLGTTQLIAVLSSKDAVQEQLDAIPTESELIAIAQQDQAASDKEDQKEQHTAQDNQALPSSEGTEGPSQNQESEDNQED